jgi:hypothetical protein
VKFAAVQLRIFSTIPVLVNPVAVVGDDKLRWVLNEVAVDCVVDCVVGRLVPAVNDLDGGRASRPCSACGSTITG